MTNTAPGRTLQKLSPVPELDPGEPKTDSASTGSSYALSSLDKCSTLSSSTNSLPDTQDVEGESNKFVFIKMAAKNDLFLHPTTRWLTVYKKKCNSTKMISLGNFKGVVLVS